MKIFIAGASGDRELIRALIQQLPAYGCTGYDWTINPGYDNPELHDPVDCACQSRHHLLDTDALILHVTEKPSPGATGEALLAHIWGVPIVILAPDGIPPENIWAHWLAKTGTVVADFIAALRHVGVRV